MAKDRELDDPKRDAEITRLLQAAGEASPSTSAEEDDDLRARVVAAAESRLAARAGRCTPWWAPLATWTRPALPIGAAACLALVVGLMVLEPPSAVENAALAPTESAPTAADAWSEFLGSSADADPAADLLAAQSSSDFLSAVLEYPLDSQAGAAQ